MAFNKSHRVAFFLHSLSEGGVASSFLRLINRFSEDGYIVDLLVAKTKSNQLLDLPSNLNLIQLKHTPKSYVRLLAYYIYFKHPGKWILPFLLPYRLKRDFASLLNLIRYLNNRQPDILFTGPTFPNLVALLAKQISTANSKVIISEHNTLSYELSNRPKNKQWKFIKPFVKQFYPTADKIIAVSDGVKQDLIDNFYVNKNNIKRIYNPVISNDIQDLSLESVNHNWFNKKKLPVILGVGRLLSQKDWPTLIRSFALLQNYLEARLIILGEGKQRDYLEELIDIFGLRQYVDMPGYVANPYAYMSKADLFVLTSKYEGLGNVIIEALACGCPVVSTNCPSGPAEILQYGKFGKLLPVGDYESIAYAMFESLIDYQYCDNLRRRSQLFAVENAYKEYLKFITE